MDVVAGQQCHPNRSPKLSHHRRSFDTVPDNVADDQKDTSVVAGHRLEPVTAGAGVLGSHQVFGSNVGASQHRQRRRKQGTLDVHSQIPYLRVPLGQFCLARFRGAAFLYRSGDIGQHHLSAFDASVFGRAGTDDDISADLLHRSRSVEVELETPLPALLDLSGPVDAVQDLDQVLIFKFGKQFSRRNSESHRGKCGPGCRVCGDVMMLWTRESDDKCGKTVECPPDQVGFTDRVVQVRVVPHDVRVTRVE